MRRLLGWTLCGLLVNTITPTFLPGQTSQTSLTQTPLVLPLPDDRRLAGTSFNSTTESPTAQVLVGLLIPRNGTITAVAPVTSELLADGSLTSPQNGGWRGAYPGTFLKLVKSGYIVGGFRFLLIVGDETVRVAQLQVFWRAWVDGAPGGTTVESPVYGERAGPKDNVKIVELRLPDQTWPTGLYGLVDAKTLEQFSLTVRKVETASANPTSGSDGTALKKANQDTFQEPRITGPTPPKEPQFIPSAHADQGGR